jgi:2-methylisocitrate lyase-like PEP mutase family enzyme
MDARCEKARLLRELHARDELLILPNAWDVSSARAFAKAGAVALATTSGAVANVHGYPDGEQIPPELMLSSVARIVAAVDVPVSADLEAGYGDPVDTAQLAWEVGAVGINFEDGAGSAEDHAAAVRAIRGAVPELVINARTDVFLHGSKDADDAIARANAYLAAGADCAFVIGLVDLDTIERITHAVDGPVNVLFPPDRAPIEDLRRIGVRRLTFGSGLHRAAVGRAEELVRAALAR